MSSEAITRNDLANILNEVLPPTPSEYKKLLWTNPNPTSDFGTQAIALDASAYDELEIYYTDYKAHDDIMSVLRVSVGQKGSMNAFFGGSTYNSGVVYVTNRQFAVTSTYVSFGNGNGSVPNNGWTTRNDMCIPQKIYGIKYERVQPPVLDAEIEVLATGIILYRIGRIRALHISDATGFTKSSLIPSADRPSASIQGVAIRTTNGNLATSFGRIIVGSNGDVSALYSSVLNGPQTGFSVVSSTDHIIGTAIWYVAE